MSRVKLMKAYMRKGEDAALPDLEKIKEFLLNNMERKYTDNEKIIMISRLDKERPDPEEAKQKYANIFKDDLYLWIIMKDSIIMENDRNELTFSIETDYIESLTFRGSLYLHGNTAYGSFRIRVIDDRLLISIFGSFTGESHLAKAIKELLDDLGIIVGKVTWDAAALRRIEGKDSAKTTKAKESGVDSELTIILEDQFGISNTPTGTGLHGRGDMKTIRYESKKYPSNWIQIAGEYGVVSSSMSDSDTIDYIIENLLSESSFYH